MYHRVQYSPVLHVCQGMTEWAVLIGCFQLCACSNHAGNGAVKKLSTVYQQVSTTRALPTAGNCVKNGGNMLLA